MTRLELACQSGGFDRGLRVLLPFRIKSLINVKVTAHFELFDRLGEAYIDFLIGCLPVLSRLRVTIRGLIYNTDDMPQQKTPSRIIGRVERLKAICMAVQLRTSGLEYQIVLMRRDKRVTLTSAADH